MAKCDEGYICQVCGEEVKGIQQSDLYLRFVIGMVDPETLHLQPERHLKCNPSLAQFIDDPDYANLDVEAGFRKDDLDDVYVAEQSELINRGFERLKEVTKLDIPIQEYPLEEFRQKFAR